MNMEEEIKLLQKEIELLHKEIEVNHKEIKRLGKSENLVQRIKYCFECRTLILPREDAKIEERQKERRCPNCNGDTMV